MTTKYSTPYYQLSLYELSEIPQWAGECIPPNENDNTGTYNGDMIKIDNALYNLQIGINSFYLDNYWDADSFNDNVITNIKLSGGITNSQLAGGITNSQLAGGITNDKLAGGITNDKLADDITNDKLAGGITKDKISIEMFPDSIPITAFLNTFSIEQINIIPISQIASNIIGPEVF